MDKILLLYLDKLTYSLPSPPPVSIRQVCFPPLPDIHIYPYVLKEIEYSRKNGIKVVLAACGDEQKVKESLLSLDAFPLFDYFIIPDEIRKDCSPNEQLTIIDTQFKKEFIGNNLFFSYPLYFHDFVGKRYDVLCKEEMLEMFGYMKEA